MTRGEGTKYYGVGEYLTPHEYTDRGMGHEIFTHRYSTRWCTYHLPNVDICGIADFSDLSRAPREICSRCGPHGHQAY